MSASKVFEFLGWAKSRDSETGSEFAEANRYREVSEKFWYVLAALAERTGRQP
jgi:hypothetical protein